MTDAHLVCCIFWRVSLFFSFFFFNDTATTEIYTLSLHDALPIFRGRFVLWNRLQFLERASERIGEAPMRSLRSEEHTSELQSRQYLVCRLLLEKKKKYHPKAKNYPTYPAWPLEHRLYRITSASLT